MKRTSLILSIALGAALFAGCAVPAERRGYRESQFSSRLEYLRFCQRYALLDYRCQ